MEKDKHTNQNQHNFIEDSDPVIKELKQNIWNNQKKIKSLFKRLDEFTKGYGTVDEREDLSEIADSIADKIADFVIGEIWYHSSDSGLDDFFAYVIYTEVSYQKYFNDIDAYNADYGLSFDAETQKIWICHREFITESIDIGIDETNIQDFIEWQDWEEEYRIIQLPK